MSKGSSPLLEGLSDLLVVFRASEVGRKAQDADDLGWEDVCAFLNAAADFDFEVLAVAEGLRANQHGDQLSHYDT